MQILVNAGPTREYFDSIRFISNPSSGRMGYAIAAAARDRGHRVVLVSGPVAIRPPAGVEFISVVSAAEMARACKSVFGGCEAAILTAAVCDYRPRRRLTHKLRKQPRARSIVLEPTEDICTSLCRRKGGRIVIAFAMEDRAGHRHAEQKLRRKGCDAVVLNGPENIGSADATVEVLLACGRWLPAICGTKRAIARRLVRLTEQLAAGRVPQRL